MANLHVFQTSPGAPIPTTSETFAGATPTYSVDNPQGQGVQIEWAIGITAGTSTTAVVVKVYRGANASGTLVATLTFQCAAGANTVSGQALDSNALALVNTVDQYALTVTQTGASGNGTINTVNLSTQSATASE